MLFKVISNIISSDYGEIVEGSRKPRLVFLSASEPVCQEDVMRCVQKFSCWRVFESC